MPSVQLARYLQLRADGLGMETAAFEAGIQPGEAKLHEAAIARGELELPRACAPARAREGNQSGEETSMSNGNIAADELRLLVERIERLDEEVKGLNDDKRDVYGEAKSRGFDTAAMKKVIKLRKLEPHVRQEAEAILTIYMDALGLMPTEASIALAA